MKPLFLRRTIRKSGGLARISFRPNGREGWVVTGLSLVLILLAALSWASNPDFGLDTAIAVFAAVLAGGSAVFILIAFLLSVDEFAEREVVE